MAKHNHQWAYYGNVRLYHCLLCGWYTQWCLLWKNFLCDSSCPIQPTLTCYVQCPVWPTPTHPALFGPLEIMLSSLDHSDSPCPVWPTLALFSIKSCSSLMLFNVSMLSSSRKVVSFINMLTNFTHCMPLGAGDTITLYGQVSYSTKTAWNEYVADCGLKLE